MPSLSTHWKYLDSWARNFAALLVGAGVFIGLGAFASWPTRLIAAWDGFAVTMLMLTWWSISSSKVENIRANARRQDLSRLFIFLFTIAAACSSMFAVIFLLSAEKKTTHLGLHAGLSVIAVVGSWTLVHTMFALRYAHAYYDEGVSPEDSAGGLEFPGDQAPNYYDFAYFSFVVGMTFQVSDVQITSKSLRALVLLHGILSFGFNTVILALTINTISGFL